MKCPKCDREGLIERIDKDGSVHHDHNVEFYLYLMVWKPRKKVPLDEQT